MLYEICMISMNATPPHQLRCTLLVLHVALPSNIVITPFILGMVTTNRVHAPLGGPSTSVLFSFFVAHMHATLHEVPYNILTGCTILPLISAMLVSVFD